MTLVEQFTLAAFLVIGLVIGIWNWRDVLVHKDALEVRHGDDSPEKAQEWLDRRFVMWCTIDTQDDAGPLFWFLIIFFCAVAKHF